MMIAAPRPGRAQRDDRGEGAGDDRPEVGDVRRDERDDRDRERQGDVEDPCGAADEHRGDDGRQGEAPEVAAHRDHRVIHDGDTRVVVEGQVARHEAGQAVPVGEHVVDEEGRHGGTDPERHRTGEHPGHQRGRPAGGLLGPRRDLVGERVAGPEVDPARLEPGIELRPGLPRAACRSRDACWTIPATKSHTEPMTTRVTASSTSNAPPDRGHPAVLEAVDDRSEEGAEDAGDDQGHDEAGHLREQQQHRGRRRRGSPTSSQERTPQRASVDPLVRAASSDEPGRSMGLLHRCRAERVSSSCPQRRTGRADWPPCSSSTRSAPGGRSTSPGSSRPSVPSSSASGSGPASTAPSPRRTPDDAPAFVVRRTVEGRVEIDGVPYLLVDADLPYAVSRALTAASIHRRSGQCLMLHAAGVATDDGGTVALVAGRAPARPRRAGCSGSASATSATRPSASSTTCGYAPTPSPCPWSWTRRRRGASGRARPTSSGWSAHPPRSACRARSSSGGRRTSPRRCSSRSRSSTRWPRCCRRRPRSPAWTVRSTGSRSR